VLLKQTVPTALPEKVDDRFVKTATIFHLCEMCWLTGGSLEIIYILPGETRKKPCFSTKEIKMDKPWFNDYGALPDLPIPPGWQPFC